MARFFRAALEELNSRPGLPWKRRLRAWKSGFTSSAWVQYQLDENDPDLYVTDLSAELSLYKINGIFNPIIADKLIFSRLLTAHQVPQPDVIAVIHDGKFFEENASYDPDLPGSLTRSLARYPRQVFRPTWCGRGHGIFVLSQDDEGLRANGKLTTLEQLCAHISQLDRYMVTEFQRQKAYAEQIFPGSVNTLRILTLWDEETSAPYVAAVSHRFGTSRSAPLDNWRHGRGGICASVCPVTATLGQVAWRPNGAGPAWSSSHPETGQPVEGVIIPGFHPCLEAVLDAALHLPFCPMIGWDVVLTENGFSVLEANPIPDLDVLQIHNPLLTDPRTRKFFQRWGLATSV